MADRGLCRVCKKSHMLTQYGGVRNHKTTPADSENCLGSGYPPEGGPSLVDSFLISQGQGTTEALYTRWAKLAKGLADEIGSNEPDQANKAYEIQRYLEDLAQHPELRHRYDDKQWRDDHAR